MKKVICFFSLTLTFLITASSDVKSKSLSAINRIEGTVYDQNRAPVGDAYIELQNAVGSLLSRTKTNSAGRFSFMGMSSGRFIIKVLPLGKDLLEQEQDLEVNNQVMQSDIVFVDFYLRPRRNVSKDLSQSSPEAIFVQEVPQNAQKLYESGVSNLEKKQDKGLAEIEEAIKIFPSYFNALSRLGKEYVERKEYKKAYSYLLRAIDINQRSASSYYSLAYAFYQLKEIPAALEAAKAVIIINPAIVEGHLLYGTLLRLNGNYQDSEKILLKAKSLSKKPYGEIHWQLALLFNKLNRNKEAADELEIYLKISPQSPDRQEVKDLISKLRASKKS